MITRSQIYQNEAAGLLRAVTMYGTLYETQLYKLYPEKPAVVKNLLTYLTRQKRLFYDSGSAYYTASLKADIDHDMIAAFWVLLDFIEKAEYHTASDFPVKICFFTANTRYDIVYVAIGNEAIINHAMTVVNRNAMDDSKCIVVLERIEQLEMVNIANACGFCTVGKNGEVSYYKRE